MTITTTILCPCGCGESVTMTDDGFSATRVEVAGCSRRRSEQGILTVSYLKSTALSFESPRPAAVQHRDGLVILALGQ